MESPVGGSSTKSVQQFNLKWNNHTNNIVQVFTEQLACEALVDVTLSCQGQFLKAHKMILSACSPYFQELFLVHTAKHPVIIMNGMHFNDMKHVIDFMYRGEVKILETDLDKILGIAESLQIKGLCNVRDKYTTKTKESSSVEEETVRPSEDPVRRSRKRRRTLPTQVLLQLKEDETLLGTELNGENLFDNDLASKIKIEPPVITDIDEPPILPTNRYATTKRIPKILMRKAKICTANEGGNKPTFIKIAPKIQNEPNQRVITLGGKVPRPPNAFMIFANEWRKKLAKEHPNDSNKEISVRLGMQWKNLTVDTKECYYSAARKADEEHRRKYPNYYYSPKEARMRKILNNSRTVIRRPSNCIDAMELCKLVMQDDRLDEIADHFISDDADLEPPDSAENDLVIDELGSKNGRE